MAIKLIKLAYIKHVRTKMCEFIKEASHLYISSYFGKVAKVATQIL